MDNKRDKTDWKRIVAFITTLLTSGVVAWIGQPFIHDNEEARSIIVSVFSIFAGFLVTIMLIIGDPLYPGSANWRRYHVRKKIAWRKLVRQKYLFMSYLLVLVLIFISAAIAGSTFNNEPDLLKKLTTYIEYAYIFLASIATVYSFLLPGRLLEFQMERFNEVISSEKRENT